jgi:CBS domain-containing protein
MATKVRDVMTAGPVAVTPDTPVAAVAEVMEMDDIGAVPVVEDDRLTGMITDRDIVIRAIAKGKDPRGMPVREIYTRQVIAVAPDDKLGDAVSIMADRQIRRLPVVDEENHLVGVVSQADIAAQAKEKEVGEMVEEISKPAPTVRRG